jgi:branched-chain amino acid transport system permease protein
MSTPRLEQFARRVWVPVALAALLWLCYMIVQFTLGPEYQQIALNMFITATLVLGLQVFSGNSGILSFGHIAFMAIGAYVSALLTIPAGLKKATFTDMPGFLHWILDTELGTVESTLIAGAVAAVFALIMAAPIVRLDGVPAGIATLALLVIVYTFNIQTTSITRGTSTMIGVPATTTIDSALIWAIIAVVIAYAYQASRSGKRLRASRENHAAAMSVGVNVSLERGVAWVLSAFLMGIGGALYGHYIIAFSAGEFYFAATFNIVLMLVIGGMTSVSGAVVGLVFVTVLKEILRRVETGPLDGKYPGFTELLLAAILLLVLIWRPRGLTGGHEVPFPGDWAVMRRFRRNRVPVGTETVEAAEPALPDASPGPAPVADSTGKPT